MIEKQSIILQVRYILRCGFPIEKHATKLYTRTLFERFFQELFRSGNLVCRETEDKGTYIVKYARTSPDSGAGRKEFVVKSNEEINSYSCICKSFDHSGIPCRHILKVSRYD
jgi:hypothetical protein